MEGLFEVILIVVVVLAVVAAIFSLLGTGELYRSIGKGGLSLDEPMGTRGPAPDTPAARAEAQAEIRQMVEAKAARQVTRGETPIDVEAEIAALNATGPAPGDEALREEVRQLVVARNERRQRQGHEPLDIEAEVDRQLRELQ